MHDGRIGGAHLAEFEPGQIGGQPRPDGGNFSHCIVEILIGIAGPVELRTDYGAAVITGRIDFFDVVEPLHDLLDRLDDGLLDFGRVGTRLARDDGDHG